MLSDCDRDHKSESVISLRQMPVHRIWYEQNLRILAVQLRVSLYWCAPEISSRPGCLLCTRCHVLQLRAIGQSIKAEQKIQISDQYCFELRCRLVSFSSNFIGRIYLD